MTEAKPWVWCGCCRAEKQRLAKLYEAFRRVNAGGSSLEQLVTIILKAVRNLVNSEHNLLLFVDNSRDQLWTKWTLGTVMDNKVCCLMPLSLVCAQPYHCDLSKTPQQGLLPHATLEPAGFLTEREMSRVALFRGCVGVCCCVCYFF